MVARLPLAGGRLHARGDERLLARLCDEIADAAATGRAVLATGERGGVHYHWKGSALRGRAALRHAARMHVLRLPAPRVAEHRNLLWLRARGFDAPRPLLSAVVVRRGLPRYQLLATETIPAAHTAAELLSSERDEGDRRALAEALGRVAGRLHAAGFVHRDLHLRNVLVTRDPDGAPRTWLLDAWRGGPGLQLRGPAHDLACLLLRGADVMRAGEVALLLRAYADERAARGAPCVLPRLTARAARARARLVRDLARRRPRADEPAPRAGWVPPFSI